MELSAAGKMLSDKCLDLTKDGPIPKESPEGDQVGEAVLPIEPGEG